MKLAKEIKLLTTQFKPVSPVNGIPIQSTLHGLSTAKRFIVEIPEHTNAKMEAEEDKIVQDRAKDGSARFYKYSPLPIPYGFVPQTICGDMPALTRYPGDGDPLDCLVVSERPTQIGDVRDVVPVCTIPFVDGGEADWKVVAVDATHRLASDIKTRTDLDRHYPGLVAKLCHWLCHYKRAEGGAGELDGEVKGVRETGEIIEAAHDCWKARVA